MKPGPKPKITDDDRKTVLATVGVGGSLQDAADLIGVDYKTLYRLRQADPEFANGVKQAVKAGKLKLIKKVGKASSWQAAAWMLERKWGREYGRKDRHEHTGANGGPIQTLDLTRLTESELEQLERLADKAGGRFKTPEPSGN